MHTIANLTRALVCILLRYDAGTIGGDVVQLRAEMPTVVGDVEVPRGADVFLLTRAPARYVHCI
jgi:hypothetical protein